ncbi:coiled-coil domain-containing protein 106b, partial [Tachysurus ichikawai]
MTEPQRSARNSTDLKNEDGYEISIPFEEPNADQTGFYNQNENMFDETVSGQTPPCNPYLLISNLRAQLQISLEKNSWLQKRIEDLEEERDFLRCQLDRFIFTTKTQERNELQPEVSQQPVSQKTVLRRAATPSTRPMMTRSGQARSQTLKRKKKNSVQDEDEEEVIEEEEYIEEDGYLEEEEVISNDDDDSDSKSCKRSRTKSRSKAGPTRVKRTRVFRIARGMERQR